MARPDNRSGGCQCGGVRYTVPAEPVALYVCHCAECRKQSASAFGISYLVPRDSLQLTSGTPRVWTRATDSGGKLDCFFCPNCGSRLWHRPQDPAQPLSVKGGSLDDPVDVAAATHIWVKRRLPGVVIPAGARCFDGEPD